MNKSILKRKYFNKVIQIYLHTVMLEKNNLVMENQEIEKYERTTVLGNL